MSKLFHLLCFWSRLTRFFHTENTHLEYLRILYSCSHLICGCHRQGKTVTTPQSHEDCQSSRKTKHHIKLSKHLVDLLKDVKVEEGEVLNSFDISVLFTRVPTTEVVKKCWLGKEGSHLVHKVWFNIRRIWQYFRLRTYFQYHGRCCNQVFQGNYSLWCMCTSHGNLR